MRDWHVEVPHAMHDQAPAVKGETGVTVTHEDLQVL